LSEEPAQRRPRPRAVAEILAARPTIEGAGVHLRRAFGAAEVPRLDPFLLLDDFRSENPAEYIAGFPWHPHRGIETVTYMLDGRVEHAMLLHLRQPDVLEGRGSCDAEADDVVEDGPLVVFHDRDSGRVKARDAPTRFLLVSGKPLHETIAWWGPIVMNSRKEIEQAVEEFQNGTFIKHRAAP